ncbi:NAD-dependent epimerase/dehydratase family protein [Hymenobacter ruricola]|uniref:NAD-dependent epimerase/dehydratase family protein n=1 Tax=Hymenobacter ruricola TaxID=2791023 RepID=A0ABS0I5C5_9BACT|nr:NAD-dependent epimerase/dehydratase family protein [Hymenobacter ruricola]MBF9222151.1 NAD-dependent epimerase/dehydratase family protein [Hymenobacter ruricola]
MKIALLGHTGFLGKNVANALQQASVEYVGASLSTGVDIRDQKQVERFFAEVQPDVVMHCAAHVGSFNYVTEHASRVFTDNTAMLLSVYNAMVAVCPKAVIIHPLANCVFPAKAEHLVDTDWEDGPLHPTVLPFAATKRLVWAAGESFRLSHAVRSVYLLVPNMYGPEDSTDPNQTAVLDALVSKFVHAQRTNQKEVSIWGTGNVIREWIYAPDLARLMLEIAHDPYRPELDTPISVAQNEGLSVRELARIIQQAVGFDGAIQYDLTKPDGVPKKVMSNVKFRAAFPDFSFTDFQAGLAATIRYYQSVL